MLQMGGEGDAPSAHCNSDMVSANAICVQVEHRFYGQSFPPLSLGGSSTSTLTAGLTVENNAADTAKVLSAVQSLFLTAGAGKRPVVTFGGSYSGATCTWFRMAYPDLTGGCVASSGVVNALYEFQDFDVVVGEAIAKPDVTCRDRIIGITDSIDGRFAAGEGESMKLLFNATKLVGTEMGDSDFMFMVADGFSMIDQYGAKAELCDGLKSVPDSADDVTKISNLASILTAHYGADFGNDCFYDSECVKSESDPGNVDGIMGWANSRSWRWQTCAQVAYMQSRPTASSSFPTRSRLLTISELEKQCLYIFGTMPARDGGNAALNEKFGADRIDLRGATNILSLSYSDDPWKAASVTAELGETLPYCATVCDGCGHCGSGVKGDDALTCGEPQSRFVQQVVAELRFEGTFVDLKNETFKKAILVNVSGKVEDMTMNVYELGIKVPPVQATFDGVAVTMGELLGKWDAVSESIVWANGDVWKKVVE